MSKRKKNISSTAASLESGMIVGMSPLKSIKSIRSFAWQLVAVNVLTVCLVCALGFVAARNLMEPLGALTRDDATVEALEAASQTIVELKDSKKRAIESGLEHCVIRNQRPGACVIDGIPLQLEELGMAPTSTVKPKWSGDETIEFAVNGHRYRGKSDFSALKHRFDLLTDTARTKEHIALILPGIQDSFRLFLTCSLAIIGCIGVGFAFLMTSRFRARIHDLVDYTGSLALGRMTEPPPSLSSFQETSVVALAVQRLANNLKKTGEQLVKAEKIAAWETVAKRLAHEIKNPLTPIALVATELGRLSDRWPGEAEALPRLKTSQRILNDEAMALDRLVREFSKFVRLPEPVLKANDLNQIVKDFVERNELHTGERVTFADDGRAIAVAADSALVRQILHNLINNALQLNGQTKVRISAEIEGQTAVLDVSDNGPGVPAAMRDRIFDAYITSKNTGDQEKGMGLGLTIARWIAEKHGGQLELAETGPTGSRFRLTLPALAPSSVRLGSDYGP